MKPIRITGFLVVVLAVILLIPFLFPRSSVTIFNYTIRIPVKRFINQTEPQYKDISQIKTLLIDSLLIDSVDSPEKKLLPDSSKNDSASIDSAPTTSVKEDSARNIIQPLEYPVNTDTLLNPFFTAIKSLGQTEQLIRILHYGDSQIEGDRITSYFRNQMQKKFGGGGVGLIPITPINSASISYVFDISQNWTRFSILNTTKKPDEPEYGLMGCFSRFTNPQEMPKEETDAWIFLKNPNTSYTRASKFNRCKVLFSGNRSPLFIELKKENTIIDADIFSSGNNTNIINWRVETGSKNLLITIRGKDSPNLYGIALDAETGIAVDNIPLRGSSGLEFTRIYKSPYDKVLNKLNVKLIILQFGVNAVTNMSRNIPMYERAFQKQLMLLRTAQPLIPVIVIGVNDISQNTQEGYITNEAVEKIRDAQRRAALASGCVFWDLYEGMGGKNSMPSWVFANPPLAQKDFLHLNALGARIIGEMFYRSLMAEYDEYLDKKSQK